MFILKKNDIHAFPFDLAAPLSDDELDVWAQEMCLTAYNSWMLPQMQAYFGSLNVTKVGDKYDSLALLKDNFPKTNDWAIGLWKIVTKMKRGALVKTQIGTVGLEHCSLVPLILAGLKKHKGIRYMDWTDDAISYLIPKPLYEAATYEPPEMSKDDLLYIRNMGLMNKVGPKAGVLKKATSQWKLTGIKSTVLGNAPALATTMLAQIWVAHPSMRNNLMILDPLDWDNMPPPLVESEVLTKTVPTNNVMDIPW